MMKLYSNYSTITMILCVYSITLQFIVISAPVELTQWYFLYLMKTGEPLLWGLCIYQSDILRTGRKVKVWIALCPLFVILYFFITLAPTQRKPPMFLCTSHININFHKHSLIVHKACCGQPQCYCRRLA